MSRQQSTRLRVLHVIDSLARAGAEQSLLAGAPHQLSDGVDLHVAYLTERQDGLRPDLEATGAVVHPPPVEIGGRGTWLRRTSALVGDLRPDVVHTTLFESDLAGRLAAARHGVPCISSLVNVAYGCEETRGLPQSHVRAAQAADVATARLVTGWHAITHHVADVMSRRLLVPRTRIEVIPRGRDGDLLGRRSPERAAAVRERLRVAPEAPLVLAVGRQERQKGHDVLLHSAALLREHHPGLVVLLAGREGGATDGLHELRDGLGLQDVVRFLGVRDDVPDLLAAADVLVFPSRWEGAGGTVLEAMALECPLVTSALPAVREAVDSTMALLVPADDAFQFAAAVDTTLRDREAARARATRARRRFEQDFTVDAAARSTADLYDRVARRPRRHAFAVPGLKSRRLADESQSA